jgi:hypothetical protein
MARIRTWLNVKGRRGLAVVDLALVRGGEDQRARKRISDVGS